MTIDDDEFISKDSESHIDMKCTLQKLTLINELLTKKLCELFRLMHIHIFNEMKKLCDELENRQVAKQLKN
jgi:hypothetical protein